MRPEFKDNQNVLHIESDGGLDIKREGWGGTSLTALTQEEQLELAVDLDNLEEKFRLACDGDSDRQMLARWVDRLCK